MFKNIMLAVDGSLYADSVLATGVSLAKAFHSHISVITVADVRVFEWATAVGADGFVPIIPSGLYQDESRKILEEKTDKILEKCTQILSKENISFETEKLMGAPADSIVEKAHLSDLIIMGKRGEFAKWDKKTLGATTEAVSRTVHKPMLVVDKEFRPFKNILIAYDGSQHANKVLQYVGHFAEYLGSEIIILCVSNDKEAGEDNCLEAEKYLKNYDIIPKSFVEAGHPEKEIVKFSHENDINLTAIGAYGNSRIKEALLGSTTEHILRFSHSAVLLAK